MARKSEVSVEKRLQAVLSLIRREEPAHLIARRYGISENSLYRWRDQFLVGVKSGMLVGNRKQDPRQKQIASLKEQLGERDRVIGELTIANRVLKKSLGESS
jgi:transposase-like protein